VLIGCALVFGHRLVAHGDGTIGRSTRRFRFLTGLGMGGAMPNRDRPHLRIHASSSSRDGRDDDDLRVFVWVRCVGGFVAAAQSSRASDGRRCSSLAECTPLLIAAAAFAGCQTRFDFFWSGRRADERARVYLTRIAPGASLPPTLSAGPDESRPARRVAVGQLFAARRAMGTILIWVVYFMNLLNLYFLNSWLPTIIQRRERAGWRRRSG
jgi:AAHS family 4-hydroxybenzoate transporter-like MFS transporter